MTGFKGIDYSTWTNATAKELAERVDTDNVKGLQGKEIFDFAHNAASSNIEKTDVFELLGLSLSTKARIESPAKISRPQNPEFDKAMKFYNEKMPARDLYTNYSYSELQELKRHQVTELTYQKLEERLYNLQKDIDKAYQECSAYNDEKIVIIPRSHIWYYRDYPYWDDRLTNFDIDDLRTRTTTDMQSLVTLKEKMAEIMCDSDTYGQPDTPYNVDEIAKQTLVMSYKDFKSKYSAELEYFKTVTRAEISSMTPTQRAVYEKAKAYAKEMLNTTINTAHTVNWDTGELYLDATLKATGDMYAIEEFEYEGITEQGISDLQSGIMYKSFEEALISKHQEYGPAGITDGTIETKPKETRKVLQNGKLHIIRPEGPTYDGQGRKVK